MSDQIRAQFEITSWDETPFDGTGVAKLTEALVEKRYTGDVEGTSTTKWLMAYAPDKTATFIGLERIRGTFAGKHGSLDASARRHIRRRIGGCRADNRLGQQRAQIRFG